MDQFSYRLVILVNQWYIVNNFKGLRYILWQNLRLLWGKQVRAARVMLGWSQTQLAHKAKVAIGTIRRMEAFEGEIASYTSTLSKVQAAMEKAGIEFLNSGQPGVRLKSPSRSR